MCLARLCFVRVCHINREFVFCTRCTQPFALAALKKQDEIERQLQPQAPKEAAELMLQQTVLTPAIAGPVISAIEISTEASSAVSHHRTEISFGDEKSPPLPTGSDEKSDAIPSAFAGIAIASASTEIQPLESSPPDLPTRKLIPASPPPPPPPPEWHAAVITHFILPHDTHHRMGATQFLVPTLIRPNICWPLIRDSTAQNQHFIDAVAAILLGTPAPSSNDGGGGGIGIPKPLIPIITGYLGDLPRDSTLEAIPAALVCMGASLLVDCILPLMKPRIDLTHETVSVCVDIRCRVNYWLHPR